MNITATEVIAACESLGMIVNTDGIAFASAPNMVSIEYVVRIMNKVLKMRSALDVMTMFRMVSQYTGNAVKFTPEYKGLPLIPIVGSSPVFLYEIVEVLDEIVDYDDVISKLPGLTYTQIHGSIMFLRRVSQFNTVGVDIDDIEQQAMAQDGSFIDSLRATLTEEIYLS